MEGIVVELISQFGLVGLILVGVVYLIWDGIKIKKSRLVTSKKLDESIDNLNKKVDVKFNDVNHRIDLVNIKVDTQYDLLNKRIDLEPDKFIKKVEEKKEQDDKEHFNKVIEQFTQAPKLHNILKLYRDRIGCDHIFFGTFHNGSMSISGIPYCKFDIIAEKFKPNHNNTDLREYTLIYKNSDILVHDNLPVIISQEDYVYYKINEDNNSPLEEIDDILYRRCIKFGVKQIALNLLRDSNMNPVGFVGCVDFDYDELNFKELNNCAKELEEIYR